MYRIALDAFALARSQGPLALLRRAGSGTVWRRLVFGGLQIRNWKPALARELLQGDGLEIGALHNPLPVGDAACVRYVDRFDIAGLRRHYPELANFELIPVDIIDDGEMLVSVPPASQDFIVASHFFEHCENPLGTMRAHFDRLKPGGLLFYAIPDKRMTFDHARANTDFSHLVADDVEGPQRSRASHYREWAQTVLGKNGPEIEATARRLMAERFSIHFHCWDRRSLARVFERARGYLDTRFDIVRLRANGPETIVILKRRS
jgi:SAM-dependent methyltransferase